MHDRLIKQWPDGEWETTERLWLHVIEKAGDNETIGTQAVGQARLDCKPEKESEIRYIQDTGSEPQTEHQVSLTDALIKNDKPQNVSNSDTTPVKGAPTPILHQITIVDPARQSFDVFEEDKNSPDGFYAETRQTTLSQFEQSDDWDGPTPRMSHTLRTAEGNVYS